MNVFIRGLFATGMVTASACTHLPPFEHVPPVDPDPAVLARVVLVGDTGRPNPAVLDSVRSWGELAPERTSVVFLGDNIYEDGLPEDPAPHEKRILDLQIAAANDHRGIFVPGNHDWHSGRPGIRRQAAYVEAARASIRFRPLDGCPGPATDETLEGIVIVTIDTEWLIQTAPDTAGCGLGDDPLQTISIRIHKVLEDASNKLVIVAAHHPPWTYGPHGGYYNWQDHLFPLTRIFSWAWVPLPVIGSIFPMGRKLLGHDQDAFSKRYRSAHKLLTEAFSNYNGAAPLIFAGGHDHSLQVLSNRAPWDYVLVSGSGSTEKLTTVTSGPDTIYARLAHGFMTIDLYPDDKVLLRVIVAGEAGVVFTRWLVNQ